MKERKEEDSKKESKAILFPFVRTKNLTSITYAHLCFVWYQGEKATAQAWDTAILGGIHRVLGERLNKGKET